MGQLINFADLKQSVTPDSPALILNVKGVRDVNRRELLGAVL
jgi:hypothetical protein